MGAARMLSIDPPHRRRSSGVAMESDPAPYPDPTAADPAGSNAVRARLLDAAADAFMQWGYDATSVDDVARSLGATKGVVYYHFRSKFELFLGVYARGMQQLEVRTAGALADVGSGPAADRLHAVCAAHVENIMRNLPYHVTIQQGVEQRRRMPLRDEQREALARLDSLRDAHEQLVRGLLDEGRNDGSLRDMPVHLTARVLIGAIVGTAIWYRPVVEGDGPEGDIVARVVDAVMGGVLPR
jgi:AcrR family transcriptional regulator